MDFLERLDLHISLGDHGARLLRDLLHLWISVNWATVCLYVSRSKVHILSPGRSGGKENYVWVDPGALKIVSEEEA